MLSKRVKSENAVNPEQEVQNVALQGNRSMRPTTSHSISRSNR